MKACISRKFFCLLLAVVMVCTLLPITALAAEPSGSIESAAITHAGGYLKNAVSVGLKNVTFKTSVQVKLYSGDTLLTTATLQGVTPGSYGFLTCCIATETADEYWALTPWTPKDDVVPDKAVLVVDGHELNTKTFTLDAEDWANLPGTVLPPSGSIESAAITHDNGILKNAVSVELKNVNFAESVAVKLYSGDTLLTTATLQGVNPGSYGFLTCCIATETADANWALTHWTPKDDVVPDKAVLVVDGHELNTKTFTLDADEWAALPGTVLPYSGSIESAVITHDNGILKNAVSVELKNVTFKTSVQVKLYSGDTLLTTATLQGVNPGSYGFLTCCIATETADANWALTPWTPKDDVVPDKAVLVVDGHKLNTKTFTLDANEWAALPGTVLPYSGSIERAAITHDNGILKNAVSVDLKNVTFKTSVQVKLYSGNTLLTTATLQGLNPGSHGFLTCCIATETADEYWALTPWTPKDDVVPDKAVLVVDGHELDTKTFTLDAEDWTNLPGTVPPSYTVTYTDGVEDEVVFADQSYTVKYNEATPAFQGDLTKYPGWKFKAWTPDLADTVTEDVTYTATWEPKGANTIIYWGNGGTRSKYSVGDTFWSEYTSAAEIKVRGNGFLSFALDEYAFNGWNTKADGTGDSYKSGDMYKFTAAHDLDKANLYAQWKLIAFNVSFNSNGGNTLDPIKVTLNKPYGTLPSAGSINGLQNLGWYLVDEQGNVTDTAVTAKTVVTLERDHTLFQKREIKTPTVKISLSRPVYNYLDKPVSLNASLTEYPALKYSYQWYKDGVALANDDLYDGVNTKSLTLKHDYVSASGVYKLVVTVTLADGSDIVVTNSPVTAEASYTLNIRRTSNMLYYDANGGEGGPSNNSDYYDKANDRYVAKVQSSQPTRSEWKFIGWNTKADGTGDSYKAGDFYVFDRQLSENGGLKAWLYAQWDHLTCAENLEDVKVITEPTCTEKGLKLCRCTVCGDEYEVEIPALGHDHGGRWTWNREEHWKKCLRCGAIIDCEEHTYGDWKPVVDNKGKDTDREERSCTVCGFTQYAQTIHIGGSTVTKPTDEQNPNTGAQVPSLLPALAVLAGAAVVLRKRK